MSDKSRIEWTNTTWNPVTGCNKISPGCKNCYAEREWKRLSANPTSVYYGRSFNDVQCHPERLEQPLKWQKPRMIFVNSMSDLFHKDVPFAFIDKVFAVMALCPQHTFQILTKRPDRMLEYMTKHNRDWDALGEAEEFYEHMYGKDGKMLSRLTEAGWIEDSWKDENGIKENSLEYWGKLPLPNVWLGVSVENQDAANERIPLLLQTPAAIRWISAEPLLQQLDISLFLNAWHATLSTDINRIDWVVTGGESGPNARPTHPQYFRFLRDQCVEAKVPFFFKQWGEFIHQTAKLSSSFSASGPVRVGKKLAGRELDGRTWDEMPEVKL